MFVELKEELGKLYLWSFRVILVLLMTAKGTIPDNTFRWRGTHTLPPPQASYLSPTSLNLAPYIDKMASPNISVSVGRTALLTCKTVNLLQKSVSWVRHRDVHLLSVGRFVYTKDKRVGVLEDPGSGEWVLKIKSTRHSDEGTYECQINTDPVTKLAISLKVVDPYSEILGDKEIFINRESLLNLTCVVHTPEIPAAIFWKHEGKLLELESASGSTTEIQTVSGSPTISYLLIPAIDTGQSGQYECSPSNTHSSVTMVHILDGNNGEKLRAMHTSNSGKQWKAGISCPVLVLVHLWLVQFQFCVQ